MDAKKLGRIGEDYAVKILEKKGYKIMARNYHAQGGELDIIAFDVSENLYILVEVKTRKNQNFAYGIESVGPQKIQKMKRAAARFFFVEKKMKETPAFEIHAIILILKNQNISNFDNLNNIFDIEYYDDLG